MCINVSLHAICNPTHYYNYYIELQYLTVQLIYSAYLGLDHFHPLITRFDNGTRNIDETLGCNLIKNIINGNVSACASHTSTAVDQEGPSGWLVLGLDPTVEPKNGRGIVRHTVIRPRCEVKLSGLERFPTFPFDL